MINKKTLTMPVREYFKIIKPEYVYLQIIPHKSTRNYNSTNIAKTIQKTYKSISRRLDIEIKKKWIFPYPSGHGSYKTNFKISYVVDIKKDNTSFYFLVPKEFKDQIMDKIYEIWPKVALNVVEPIQKFSNNTVYYQLNYKKEDALSLQIDKKSNEPLNSVLAVMEIMQETDRVTLVYNFLPKNQFGWDKRYSDTRKKIENMQVIIKDRTTFQYKLKTAFTGVNYIFNSVFTVLNDLTGGKKEINTIFNELLITSNILDTNKRISSSTQCKRDKTVLDAQILVATSCTDMTREKNISQSVCNSFSVLDEEGGNELISKKVKFKKDESIDIEDYKFKGVGENTFSVDECQSFISQPGRMLMRSLGIKHTETEEVKVPSQLKKGYISLGPVECKGETQEAFIEDEYNTGSLPLVEIGSQGAGKTTFMSNYYRFANKRKEGGVIIDFIKNCEMSDEVIKYLPPEDLIILDYTKSQDIQSLAFNEYQIDPKMDVYDKLDLMNKQAQQVLTFVNSINIDQPLSSKMRKYLSASTNVVFATGESRFKEIVKCLEDYEVRASYVSKLSAEEKGFLEDEVKALSDLDDYSSITKKEPMPHIIGTKLDRIEGVIDRISLLREDFKLKYMFNKSAENNINFAEALEAGKTIIIRMPQDKFSIHSKNVITTFLLAKVWNATEIRGSWNEKPKPTHIAVDEIFQTQTAMQMLKDTSILPQTRKFGCKFVLSCQYLDQINTISETLEGAGASYMLMNGTSEKDFKRFEEKIEGFEFEDLRDMKQYSSLNLIYYSKGYSSFISKLPAPLIINKEKPKLLKIKYVKYEDLAA